MIDDSPKKFDRIIAILIQLQSKRIIKAQELADRFQVSLRTIYRDIKTLESAGVPILSEAGTGYSIMEGYKLPPVMFTQEEATSFVAAEKLMQRFTDKSLGNYFQSAMYKLKSVLRWSEKEWIDLLDTEVLVQGTARHMHQFAPNALELLMNGIVKKQQVQMHYQSMTSDQPLERNIEPIGLYHEHEFWYLLAYCHLRQDYRKFRTDRIHNIKKTELSFGLQHQPLSYYLNEQVEERPKYKIVIAVAQQQAKWMQRNKHMFGFNSEVVAGNEVVMTFLYADKEEYFARWFLMMGDAARIIAPESLKITVRHLLDRIAANLDGTI